VLAAKMPLAEFMAEYHREHDMHGRHIFGLVNAAVAFIIANGQEYKDRRATVQGGAFARACNVIGPGSLIMVFEQLEQHRQSVKFADDGYIANRLRQQPIQLFTFFEAFGHWYQDAGDNSFCQFFNSLYAVIRYYSVDGFFDWPARTSIWTNEDRPEMDKQRRDGPGEWVEGIIELLMARKNCCCCDGDCPARTSVAIAAEVERLHLTDDVLCATEDMYPVHESTYEREPRVMSLISVIDRRIRVKNSLELTLAWRMKSLLDRLHRDDYVADDFSWIDSQLFENVFSTECSIEERRLALDFWRSPQFTAIYSTGQPPKEIYPAEITDIGAFIVPYTENAYSTWAPAWKDAHGRVGGRHEQGIWRHPIKDIHFEWN